MINTFKIHKNTSCTFVFFTFIFFTSILQNLTVYCVNNNKISEAPEKGVKILAIVNNQPITEYDFVQRKRLLNFVEEYQSSVGETPQEYEDILDYIIMDLLFEEHFYKSGMSFSFEEKQFTLVRFLKSLTKLDNQNLHQELQKRGIDSETFSQFIEFWVIRDKLFAPFSQRDFHHDRDQKIKADTLGIEVQFWLFRSLDQNMSSVKKLKNIRNRITSCEDINENKNKYAKDSYLEFFNLNSRTLSAKIESMIKDFDEQSAGTVFQDDDGYYKFLFICKKKIFLNVQTQELKEILYLEHLKHYSADVSNSASELKKEAHIEYIKE